ncbi:hypothetical protein [Novosphingobium sp.]|uniref:hypothetical protein n=1 Tax=Novosphingobium sp. TaxID=1874826 RepID=UPI00286D3DF9|nr:hypothetical protein [Novosphingobium sp.]
MKRILIATLGSVLIATAPAVAAAQTNPVELIGDVKVDKVVVENGKEKHVLVEPGVVVPGDALLFTTTYRNAGATPIKDFVVTNPLPDAVQLAPQGADQLVVSVDGGKTFGKLTTRRVTGSDGAPRAAVEADVTHIRWVLPVLAPGASGALSYHAIVR